jgi:hypothetical protein
MTNPTNSSPTRTSPPGNPKEERLRRVERLVAAHPLKRVVVLPPEDLEDFFRSKVGVALLADLAEWQHRVSADCLCDARAHDPKAVASMYIAAGIDEVCTHLIELPKKVKEYLEELRKSKEK